MKIFQSSFYYSEEELKTPDPDTGKRLYFSNEVKTLEEINNTTKARVKKLIALESAIEENENNKAVFDKDCAKIINSEGEDVAISKSAFAELIRNKKSGFENFKFENFKLIFQVLEEIISN